MGGSRGASLCQTTFLNLLMLVQKCCLNFQLSIKFMMKRESHVWELPVSLLHVFWTLLEHLSGWACTLLCQFARVLAMISSNFDDFFELFTSIYFLAVVPNFWYKSHSFLCWSNHYHCILFWYLLLHYNFIVHYCWELLLAGVLVISGTVYGTLWAFWGILHGDSSVYEWLFWLITSFLYGYIGNEILSFHSITYWRKGHLFFKKKKMSRPKL